MSAVLVQHKARIAELENTIQDQAGTIKRLRGSAPSTLAHRTGEWQHFEPREPDYSFIDEQEYQPSSVGEVGVGCSLLTLSSCVTRHKQMYLTSDQRQSLTTDHSSVYKTGLGSQAEGIGVSFRICRPKRRSLPLYDRSQQV